MLPPPSHVPDSLLRSSLGRGHSSSRKPMAPPALELAALLLCLAASLATRSFVGAPRGAAAWRTSGTLLACSRPLPAVALSLPLLFAAMPPGHATRHHSVRRKRKRAAGSAGNSKLVFSSAPLFPSWNPRPPKKRVQRLVPNTQPGVNETLTGPVSGAKTVAGFTTSDADSGVGDAGPGDAALSDAGPSDTGLSDGNGTAGGGGAQPQQGMSLYPYYWPGLKKNGTAVKYHRGGVLTGTINVYLLFYGNWSKYGGNDIDVITNFFNSLSVDSAAVGVQTVHQWWNTVLQYYNRDNVSAAADVAVAKSFVTTGTYAKSLGDGTPSTTNDDIFGLIKAAIDQAIFPLDPNGLYYILTSADVSVGTSTTGFCSEYCAWHSFKKLRGVDIPYAFVGDPTSQCTSCSSAFAHANGFPGADAMMSNIAHELVDSTLNPNTVAFAGWFALDISGWQQEPADLCNRVFRDRTSKLYKNGPRSYFNLIGLSNFKYLVQTIPDLSTNTCALQGDSAS